MKNKICTIKILNEVRCVILGIEDDEYAVLNRHYGILTKSHRFDPRFILDKWDGKIYFFTEKGLTYINLLPEIMPVLQSLGYKFKVIDQRQQLQIDIKPIDENYFSEFGIKFAKHQVEAINAIIDDNSGLVEAGTGAGKSYVNAAICDLYQKKLGIKTITIVPSKDLVGQTRQSFKDVGLDVGEYSGDNKDLNHNHIISTWQSINYNPAIMGMFHMVVCDEAHLATGKSLQKILNENGSHIYVRVGLTGTVPKDACDAMTIRCTLGEVKYKITASDLIEVGWLSDLFIKIYQLKENLTKEWNILKEKNPEEYEKLTYAEFKNTAFPDFAAERSYIMGKDSRNDFISEMITVSREEEKGNCLVLVNSIKQGRKLHENIPGSYFVEGADSKKIRKEIYDLFSTNNDIVVIATYKLASTGLNIPRIFNLFLIDAGKSFTTIIQSIGRGLRKAEDKDHLNVYDICSDLKYSKRHLRERTGYYKEQNYNYSKKAVAYD